MSLYWLKPGMGILVNYKKTNKQTKTVGWSNMKTFNTGLNK